MVSKNKSKKKTTNLQSTDLPLDLFDQFLQSLLFLLQLLLLPQLTLNLLAVVAHQDLPSFSENISRCFRLRRNKQTDEYLEVSLLKVSQGRI